MGIGLTTEHRALADSVRGLTRREAGHDALARQGVLGLHVPEDRGGQGFGLLELCVALEVLGERRVRGPYLPTVLAAAAASRSPAGADLVGGLADGSLTAAVVLPAEPPAPDNGPTLASGTNDDPTHPPAADDGPTRPPAADDGPTHSPAPDDGPTRPPSTDDGPAGLVGGHEVGLQEGVSTDRPHAAGPRMALGAAEADLFLVPIGAGGWALLDRADVLAEPVSGVDLDRDLCAVTVVTVPGERVLGAVPVRELAAVLLAADACGVAAWAVATAAEYAKVREQFGRPIGQFQGVKHRLAAALVVVEQARAAVWDAARALDDPCLWLGERPSDATAREEAPVPPPAGTALGAEARQAAAVAGTALGAEARLAVGVAGVLGVEAGVRCAADAIQVLGGVGYTFEHDAHRYYRRALSDRMLAGDPGVWAGEVAALALGGVRRSMEPDLPEEAAPLREAVRAQAASLRAADPSERRRRFAEEGWIMPHLPEPWGRAASPLEQVIIHEEFRSLKRPNLGIGAWAVPSIVRHGTRDQQERFLPGTFTGEIVWCQLFSEPGAGSDLAGLSTRATRVEGGWTLTGQKIWTSLAQYAHWGICLARTSPDRPKHEGITYFLVDMAAPGVTVRPLKEINGDALFNEVFLDDVFVPDDRVVGEVDGGWRVARDTLAHERVALGDSWGPGSRHTDLAAFAARLPLREARREQAGRLWAEGQAISALGLRVTLSQLAADRSTPAAPAAPAGPAANGVPPSRATTTAGASPSGVATASSASRGLIATASSVRKLLGMRHAQAVSEFCWELAPADPHWSRMILATRAFTIGGGTTEVQLNIIAERALGLPRDP
ncbi:acyl-CoA dehydrogenase [Nonomuraea sp. MCN248]|uniref:Acyl-CoA dehydrogenase n=1 Tax=Nonomuraea corallina TaxID=2989783 RepID=A0ABT4SAL9_9ACTN|nr:acyl-CoA dehydrogenase [Nonomuraea corallina]MDA0634251.1 acyl-CoA dehydrogenase [Nonomuraea corallina]